MNPSKGLLVALWIAAAGIAGWVWYASTDSGWTESGSTVGTGKVQPGREGKPLQSGLARSKGDAKALIEREDPEWWRFGRTNVVFHAISTIPRHFRASDTYRDQALNPRDTYIPPPHRKQLSAIVDSFMPRIREADRQAIVAHAEAVKMRTAVAAVELPKDNRAQTIRSGTRQNERMQFMEDIAAGEAFGRPTQDVIADAVQNPEPVGHFGPPTMRGKGGQPPITPQPVVPEPLRLRRLSISLREELLDRMTKLLLGIGVLRQVEANAITISIKRRLHRPQPRQPK